MKYLVEVLSTFRNVYVVEAENEEDALLVAENSDDNWQEWLGQQKLDVRVYDDSQKEYFKSKDKYFWEGYTSLDENGHLVYHHPDGSEKVGEKVK
jgi:hypothetical protein